MKKTIRLRARFPLAVLSMMGCLGFSTPPPISALLPPPPPPPPAPAASSPEWSDLTTGAAMGYCLAKHPYFRLDPGVLYRGDRYTKDGYEVVAPPGIVGAVRRNFVYRRTTLTADEGNRNLTCEKACAEFGKLYNPEYKGVPLKQRVRGHEKPMNSGIGDMAALAMPDQDFSLGRVFAGFWSRGNNWHESDVAQADFCCCQSR